MRRRIPSFVIAVGLLFLSATVGCSSKLSRRKAAHQIDAMLKPDPTRPNKGIVPANAVPGLTLPEDDQLTSPSFSIGHIGVTSSTSDHDLLNALDELGYISMRDTGPGDVSSKGFPAIHYDSTRDVSVTAHAGSITKTEYSEDYSTGFSCYPEPQPTQCNLPPLIDADEGHYEITGIVQDEVHAQVHILIPWKLTTFGLELKPFAAEIEKDALNHEGFSDYYVYPALYSWERFLNSHGVSGKSPATIQFQKFDDGWRVVDENGKSEKDFN